MLSIKYLIVSLADAYSMVLFVYVLMSWFPTDRGILADINRVLAKVCDPYLNLFRKLIPPVDNRNYIICINGGRYAHHRPACITIWSTFTDKLVLMRRIVFACEQDEGTTDGYHLG